ncbi:hypothetical protein Hanom_Chr08g00744321 [Helianthus anomalus]
MCFFPLFNLRNNDYARCVLLVKTMRVKIRVVFIDFTYQILSNNKFTIHFLRFN